MGTENLSRQIEAYIAEQPRFFADIVRNFGDFRYRDILLSWSDIREKDILKRDKEGRYLIGA